MSNDYHNDIKTTMTLRLREQLTELPTFLVEFFRGIADTKSARTRIGYAYDLKIFFTFLTENCKNFMDKNILDLTIEDLGKVAADDIEAYMEYLSYYTKDNELGQTEFKNEERGKSRKLASLRTLFKYFYKKRKLNSNPSELVDFPKLHAKAIVRLEADEVANLLDEVESGNNLTVTQQKFHEYTKLRDLALITLLLGTGMRISECVGINLKHIDFRINGVKVTRKGGNEAVLYFGDEVAEALFAYIEEREKVEAKEGHEDALFLSLQKKRISDRNVQILVKKYASLVTGLKKITPHKLRSTYGTTLYRETGDIYLVADVLGHSDVNTTKKHYADMDEERRRQAAKYVKLRKS